MMPARERRKDREMVFAFVGLIGLTVVMFLFRERLDKAHVALL